MGYVPLHVHTIHSAGGSIITPAELVSRAAFLKMPAVAVTDNWSLYGHYQFARLALNEGVKPLFGAVIRTGSLLGREGVYRLTLLAENDTGYRHLVRLVNSHYLNGEEDIVEVGDLIENRSGLIVLSGGLDGEASDAAAGDNLEKANEVLKKMLQIFGEGNVFMELTDHGLKREGSVNKAMAGISRKLGIPLVAVNQDRYILKEDEKYFRALRRIRREEDREGNIDNMEEYYLKSESEMEPYFYTLEGALENSGLISERCNVDILKSGVIDFYRAPSPGEKLEKMAHRRFLLKYHQISAKAKDTLEKRLRDELDMIKRQKVSGFLLFLRKLIEDSARRGVWMEIMGGSVQESFIAYLIGIIPLNPVEHNLILESLAGSGEGVPGPVDMYSSQSDREKVLETIRQLLPGYYTYFQMELRRRSFQTVVKELTEASSIDHSVRKKLLSLVSGLEEGTSLTGILEDSRPLLNLYRDNEMVRRVMDAADKLRGRLVSLVMNSSRCVILPRRMEEYFSVIKGGTNERFIMMDNRTLEETGGISISLQHSHFVAALLQVVESHRGREDREIKLWQADAMDGRDWGYHKIGNPRTMKLIAEGDTTGVYLLESRGIRELLVKIRPSDFDQLINVVSLYRPAPLKGNLWQRYIKNGEENVEVQLPHSSLSAPLKETRGILLFREQVRSILQRSAGLSGDQMIRVENALESRDSGKLSTARLMFIRGAMENSMDEQDAQKIFDYLLHNMKFTHHKSRVCFHAFLSYRTAYLKAYYFEEYFQALLNCNRNVRDRLKGYLDYLESSGITILPLDINRSSNSYRFEEGGLRPPLPHSRSLNEQEAIHIVEERRRGGEFETFDQLIERVPDKVSYRAILYLIEQGAMNSLEGDPEMMRRKCERMAIRQRRMTGDEPVESEATGEAQKNDKQLDMFDQQEE